MAKRKTPRAPARRRPTRPRVKRAAPRRTPVRRRAPTRKTWEVVDAAPLYPPAGHADRGAMLERVPIGSLRGVLGLFLLVILGLFTALIIVPELIRFLQGRSETEGVISPELIWANILLQLVFFFLVPLLYIRLVRPAQNARDAVGLYIDGRLPRMVAIGIGAAIVGTIALVSLLLLLQQAGLLTEPKSGLIDEMQLLVREHPEFLLATPLAAGLFEETFFRGFLQPRIGLLASNVLFGLVHLAYGTILQLAVPVVLGLALGLLYRWTRNLWAPVAAHATYDAIQLALLYFADAA